VKLCKRIARPAKLDIVAHFYNLTKVGNRMLYNLDMQAANTSQIVVIPERLKAYFQEYDPDQLDLKRDANLVIQRVLEFGTWDEIRWLFELYGARRIRLFVRQHGERWLKPVSFNYWRKLLRVRQWKKSPFPTPKGELWVR
jgi:hypothetical protein